MVPPYFKDQLVPVISYSYNSPIAPKILIIDVMRRKFKQWWSTIPPISTKRTITSHLNSQ